MRVLLTGSAGFIGSAIDRALTSRGDEVVRVDLMLPDAHGTAEPPSGVPELGRFGARADNPTLLDRNYWLGWVVMATLVVGAVVVGAVLVGAVLVGAVATRRRTAVRGGDHDASTGGR